MRDLGDRTEAFPDGGLSELALRHGRPDRMPDLPDGRVLLCGFDQGAEERLIVCETLDDVQRLFDAWARGGASRIRWYAAREPKAADIMERPSAGPMP